MPNEILAEMFLCKQCGTRVYPIDANLNGCFDLCYACIVERLNAIDDIDPAALMEAAREFVRKYDRTNNIVDGNCVAAEASEKLKSLGVEVKG